ncbi:MAG: L-histidine N(alpha)-methyltransferase [Flavobacteriales bacterium]|jgi:dimethylhistidine N-methyltransferase|nr:L-histidine N(alpha)-methyltransferase [Flavobacteriales bacterium]
MKTTFKEDILLGLQKEQKVLPSRYFYDKKGDALFQQIMHIESYYLPGCEREIIADKSDAIGSLLKKQRQNWNIVELGAGDGTKTLELLKKLLENKLEISYTALDISPNILKENRKNIEQELPNLPISTVTGNYFETCHSILKEQKNNLILFLGSNIGNYNTERTKSFFQWLKEGMQPEDLILIAFDLKKNPHTILKAYNDDEGITKAFNLNLLTRINRELEGNFDTAAFDHYPYYDPISGNCYSFIVSLKKQEVIIAGEVIPFKKHEVIHTEISKKYNLSEIENLCAENGFLVEEHFLDAKEYYSLSLLHLK